VGEVGGWRDRLGQRLGRQVQHAPGDRRRIARQVDQHRIVARLQDEHLQPAAGDRAGKEADRFTPTLGIEDLLRVEQQGQAADLVGQLLRNRFRQAKEAMRAAQLRLRRLVGEAMFGRGLRQRDGEIAEVRVGPGEAIAMGQQQVGEGRVLFDAAEQAHEECAHLGFHQQEMNARLGRQQFILDQSSLTGEEARIRHGADCNNGVLRCRR
jgi:hypothetical protein